MLVTLQSNYTSYDTPRFRKLSDDQTERLHHASLEVLDRTGVVLYEPEAVALLQRKGLHYEEVDAGRGARVRIPPGLVEWALGVAPKRAVLCDRNGRRVMPLERNNVFFGPGSDCPNVIDVRTGERRVGTLRDVEEASLICDALPNIDFLMSFCIASDVDQLVYDRHQMRAMLTNSVKPILTVTMEFSGAQDAVLMAEAVVGGAEALRRNPITALYINVTHPLRHNTEALQKLLFMAEKGLPTTYAPVVLRGMSGPVTAAGAIALSNAGELAGLVISQLKREGAPVILTGGVNDMLDMRTMVDSYTDPQNRVMLVELAHRYGLPIFGLAGCSDSKIPDEQAAAEAAFSIMLETLAGAQMAHDVGYLDGGLTNSIEQIVMCDEMIGYAKQFMKGLVIDEETLALDLIDEIGPFGDWMGADHTRRHYKEDWYPKLFERRAYEDWSRAGGKTLRQRAQDKALKILATHKPEPLPTDVAARLDEIVAGARP
jgi:trimethylamine--corrinoid protein Co-methyltransferase